MMVVNKLFLLATLVTFYATDGNAAAETLTTVEAGRLMGSYLSFGGAVSSVAAECTNASPGAMNGSDGRVFKWRGNQDLTELRSLSIAYISSFNILESKISALGPEIAQELHDSEAKMGTLASFTAKYRAAFRIPIGTSPSDETMMCAKYKVMIDMNAPTLVTPGTIVTFPPPP